MLLILCTERSFCNSGLMKAMVNGQHLYSTFIQSAVQSVHSHTHTNSDCLPCKAPTSLSGATGGWMSCSGTPRHTQGGIEPVSLRLPGNCAYLLEVIQKKLMPQNSTNRMLLTCLPNLYLISKWPSQNHEPPPLPSLTPLGSKVPSFHH